MADTTHDTHHDVSPSGSTHISDARILWIVWIVLMALLVLTYVAAQFNFGKFNLIIAVLIAFVKTALVVLFFMGVKYNSKLTWLWASLGFLWMFFLFGTMGDYITREWVRLPEGW